MPERASSLSDWSAEQKAQGRRWVDAWRRAGPALERVRRQELRDLDTFAAIARLCGTAAVRGVGGRAIDDVHVSS